MKRFLFLGFALGFASVFTLPPAAIACHHGKSRRAASSDQQQASYAAFDQSASFTYFMPNQPTVQQAAQGCGQAAAQGAFTTYYNSAPVFADDGSQGACGSQSSGRRGLFGRRRR